jgi:hypothetical protein
MCRPHLQILAQSNPQHPHQLASRAIKAVSCHKSQALRHPLLRPSATVMHKELSDALKTHWFVEKSGIPQNCQYRENYD